MTSMINAGEISLIFRRRHDLISATSLKVLKKVVDIFLA